MKRIVLVLSLLLAAAVGHPAAQPPAAPAASNHVVIISLDGFAGWALDDPHLPAPTLRRLAASGAVANGMRPVNPTVTWANHTSMVTGVRTAKHHVIFNGLLVREPGVPPRVEPWRDKKDMVKATTLYDVAHERGLTTAQVDWVAIFYAPTVTWEFRERPDPKNPVSQELVKAGIISEADLEGFGSRNILFRDHIWTMAAAHILRQHRPNLMMFHLLNLDSTQHRYGPRTPAAMTAMAHLDSQVATIVETLEDSGLAERTTVFVVSDHGFKAVKRHIRPNSAFLKAGLLEREQNKVTRAEVYSVPEGGTAIVYVTMPDPSGSILKRAKDALAGVEGIDAIVEPPDFADYGLPQPSDGDQMGALLLVAKDGYAFTGEAGDQVVADAPAGSGSHGYVASDPDLSALFIASGRGIRPGVTLNSVATIDLAPTMARLLGIELKDVDGRVITEILASEPATAAPKRD
ncbi:MAG: alkaline phosphatase family protein [Vicinamibacterales bacterium]